MKVIHHYLLLHRTILISVALIFCTFLAYAEITSAATITCEGSDCPTSPTSYTVGDKITITTDPAAQQMYVSVYAGLCERNGGKSFIHDSRQEYITLHCNGADALQSTETPNFEDEIGDEVEQEPFFGEDGEIGDEIPQELTSPAAQSTKGSQFQQSTKGSQSQQSSQGDTNSLQNPTVFNSVSEFLNAVIDVFLIFATPIVILFIMYAGFLFATARGNEQQLTQAKQAILWALVGGFIVLGAKLIGDVISATIQQIAN